jgi:hypothetical protein
MKMLSINIPNLYIGIIVIHPTLRHAILMYVLGSKSSGGSICTVTVLCALRWRGALLTTRDKPSNYVELQGHGSYISSVPSQSIVI